MKNHSKVVRYQKIVKRMQKLCFAERYRGNRKTRRLTLVTQMVAQTSEEKLRRLRELTDKLIEGMA